MKNYHARKNVYKIYKKGNWVFVRNKKQKGKKRFNRAIVSGTVVKRYKDDANYDFRLDKPNCCSSILKKVRIEDLADCPDSLLKKKTSIKHRYLIPLTHNHRLQAITDQDFEVVYDPSGDGNCQFSA